MLCCCLVNDTPNSVRPEIGIYVGDQEPGPAQEIGKKRGKARVDVEEKVDEGEIEKSCIMRESNLEPSG